MCYGSYLGSFHWSCQFPSRHRLLSRNSVLQNMITIKCLSTVVFIVRLFFLQKSYLLTKSCCWLSFTCYLHILNVSLVVDRPFTRVRNQKELHGRKTKFFSVFLTSCLCFETMIDWNLLLIFAQTQILLTIMISWQLTSCHNTLERIDLMSVILQNVTVKIENDNMVIWMYRPVRFEMRNQQSLGIQAKDRSLYSQWFHVALQWLSL